MENLNFGIAKNAVFGKIKNEFISNDSVNESKEISSEFISIIKESPILQLEFEVYKNLENKHIENDVIATRYIDSNVSLFENYTRDEVLDENKKLEKFVKDSEEKNNLYESINELILQATKSDETPNIDKIHESFTIVLEHIKSKKEKDLIKESKAIIPEGVDRGDLIKIAITKFNEKYSNLNESEKTLLKNMVMGSDKEKKEIFESLKKTNLDTLGEIEKNGIADKINETIDRIEKMNFSSESSIKDIVSLFELKNNLS